MTSIEEADRPPHVKNWRLDLISTEHGRELSSFVDSFSFLLAYYEQGLDVMLKRKDCSTEQFDTAPYTSQVSHGQNSGNSYKEEVQRSTLPCIRHLGGSPDGRTASPTARKMIAINDRHDATAAARVERREGAGFHVSHFTDWTQTFSHWRNMSVLGSRSRSIGGVSHRVFCEGAFLPCGN